MRTKVAQILQSPIPPEMFWGHMLMGAAGDPLISGGTFGRTTIDPVLSEAPAAQRWHLSPDQRARAKADKGMSPADWLPLHTALPASKEWIQELEAPADPNNVLLRIQSGAKPVPEDILFPRAAALIRLLRLGPFAMDWAYYFPTTPDDQQRATRDFGRIWQRAQQTIQNPAVQEELNAWRRMQAMVQANPEMRRQLIELALGGPGLPPVDLNIMSQARGRLQASLADQWDDKLQLLKLPTFQTLLEGWLHQFSEPEAPGGTAQSDPVAADLANMAQAEIRNMRRLARMAVQSAYADVPLVDSAFQPLRLQAIAEGEDIPESWAMLLLSEPEVGPSIYTHGIGLTPLALEDKGVFGNEVLGKTLAQLAEAYRWRTLPQTPLGRWMEAWEAARLVPPAFREPAPPAVHALPLEVLAYLDKKYPEHRQRISQLLTEKAFPDSYSWRRYTGKGPVMSPWAHALISDWNETLDQIHQEDAGRRLAEGRSLYHEHFIERLPYRTVSPQSTVGWPLAKHWYSPPLSAHQAYHLHQQVAVPPPMPSPDRENRRQAQVAAERALQQRTQQPVAAPALTSPVSPVAPPALPPQPPSRWERLAPYATYPAQGMIRAMQYLYPPYPQRVFRPTRPYMKW